MGTTDDAAGDGHSMTRRASWCSGTKSSARAIGTRHGAGGYEYGSTAAIGAGEVWGLGSDERPGWLHTKQTMTR